MLVIIIVQIVQHTTAFLEQTTVLLYLILQIIHTTVTQIIIIVQTALIMDEQSTIELIYVLPMIIFATKVIITLPTRNIGMHIIETVHTLITIVMIIIINIMIMFDMKCQISSYKKYIKIYQTNV